MSRPQYPYEEATPSSDDTPSFGGLADMLEPDPDAITSMRRLGAASVRHPLHGTTRSPAPIQLQDFAFADTIVANELSDEPPPPSGPIYVHDPLGNTNQCVTPLSFPLPPAGKDVDLATRLRVLVAHTRHAVRRSLEEMNELWAGTADMVADGQPGAGTQLRRALAIWSCFQWSRADFTRAAMIGLAVFITAAAVGATTMDLGDDAASPAAGASSGVRAGRTLDQHTGKKFVVHAKR
jgi:hypothetical protein